MLDTNVVLDWLFFRDARCAGLDAAITSGMLCWVATEAMRAELEHVLTREPFSAKPELASAVLAGWQQWARLHHGPALATSANCRCTDPDDQKFIDLALHLGAPTWLISRDRAVLRLARAAARHGVRIVSIAGWAPAEPTFSG